MIYNNDQVAVIEFVDNETGIKKKKTVVPLKINHQAETSDWTMDLWDVDKKFTIKLPLTSIKFLNNPAIKKRPNRAN